MDSGITGTPVASLRKCGYCDCEKEGLPVFYCETCGNWVHSGCLLSGSPSPILFDNYFNFVCIRCSEDGKESFTRVKMTWNQVTSLALFNIAQSSPGKDGFHKWKEVVVEFIEKYWQLLFGSYKKKTSSWVSTIAATLSAGNPHQFTSGYGFFKESGWWKLTDPSIPPEYNPHSTFSKAKDARTSKAKISSTTATPSPNTTKMDTLRKRPSLLPFQTSKSKEKRSNSQKNCIENERSFVDMDSPTFEGCENSAQSPVLDASVLAEDCSSEASFPSLPSLQVLSEESDQELEADQQGRSGNAQSAFSPVRRRSIKLRTTQESITTPPRLHDMPLYEERSLLKRLDAYGTRLRKIPKAYQLRRKLLVRQRKRELNLPIFNFDKLVNKLLAEDLTLQSDSVVPAGSLVRSRYPQILDRFQSSFPAANVSAVVQCMVQQSLVGCTGGDIPESIVSPYTQRVLKPYIRRDHECKPLKLQVLQQIHSHGKSGKESTEPPTSSIDYCYVRHQHIPSVNSLCHHFFWPGIDMTETLQYPDFTVVALYRKLVIGFGFMVPDVSFNEAYITFLFVHPDWRCAGIGTFMLYHLIQTCMGKDVTLHVSASNSAMLLYQKFGFKPEAFIADFYEKYYAADSRECKHAFFLRLRR